MGTEDFFCMVDVCGLCFELVDKDSLKTPSLR